MAANDLRQNLRRTRAPARPRAGVGLALLLAWALAWSGSAAAPARVFFSQLGRGNTDGAVLELFDPALGLYATVGPGFHHPSDLTCAAGEALYVTELFAPPASIGVRVGAGETSVSLQGEREEHRLVRLSLDGSSEVLVRWENDRFQPSSAVLAPSGALLLGTTSVEDGRRTQGLWQLALPGLDGEPELRQLLEPDAFLPPRAPTGYSVRPLGFLSSGPYAGDLLIVDAPVQAFVPGGRVLRALAPDFTRLESFVPAFVDPESGVPFKPAGMAVRPDGEVLVSDFNNDKLLRFGPDGAPRGTFAEVKSPNQLAVSPTGDVYATNVEAVGPTVRGHVFAWDARGQRLGSVRTDSVPRAVAVCSN